MKTRNLITLFITLFLMSASLQAQQSWNVDKAHAQVTFTTVHNTISDIKGRFNDFDATIIASEKDFSDANVELSIKVASIDTEVKMRDDHLRSGDFFDAEKHPEITFKSTSIEKGEKENHYRLKGDLTIRGITKPVTMDLWYRGTIENDKGKQIAGFQVTGTINRLDFNVGSDFPEALISNEVVIKADGEFIKE